MKKITAIAIDDEPLALEIIKCHAAEVSFLDLKAVFTAPQAAIAYLSQNHVDVLFADIRMPDMSGLELAGLYNRQMQTVFTTAYPEYAVQGFEIDATDYLLKPVSLLRFLQACNKAMEKIKHTAATEVFLKDGTEWIKIKPADIKYAEAQGNYIKLVTTANDILLRMSFSELEEKLKGNYLRAHKSYMVNPAYIDRIEHH